MNKTIHKKHIFILLLTIIFALSSLLLSGCSINAKLILKVYNQITSTNSFGYEQICVIDFYGSDFVTKSSYLKINGNLLELKVIENELGDLNGDEPIVTRTSHIYYDENFKYEKQGETFVKTVDSPSFNNDNKINLKEKFLEKVKLTSLEEENKTLLEASVKHSNVNDVFNTENLSNASVKILFNNKTKKVEQLIVTYLSENGNLVTITTNYFQSVQEIILPLV